MKPKIIQHICINFQMCVRVCVEGSSSLLPLQVAPPPKVIELGEMGEGFWLKATK